MSKLKEKVYDWKDRLRDRHMLTLVVTLIAIIVILGIFIYKKQTEYRQISENSYNMAFYEVVNYVEEVETYLAKSLISASPEQGAQTLTQVWREANLAQAYLAQLPISNEGLSNTAKFLNQVSDYSYSLSRKNINNERLTDEDFNNLTTLHDYSNDLKNTLNELSNELNNGRISWGELTKKGTPVFAQQVDNISKDSFSNLEENFHEYAGLIYDGAFSEHMTNPEQKGLTGEDINSEQARQKVIDFIGEENIKEITENGLSENGNIPSYQYFVTKNDEDETGISIAFSKKGGHIVYMNSNREVVAESISQEIANELGKDFLKSKGFSNMKETYYLKQNGIVTINYAYIQNNIIMYPDLIKVKVALDNGEIMGIETTGYLNSHHTRDVSNIKITKEEAKKNINTNLEILSEGLAVIPTEYQTEVLCYEFKGRVNERDFLVYVNTDNGKEEDILVILDTPDGTLTM